MKAQGFLGGKEMIFGIGIDVVDLGRMEKIMHNNPKFYLRILTKNEQDLFLAHSKKRQIEFLAGRFACKEAFSKAYGTGIGPISFQDIEILRHKNGQPYVAKSPFSGKCFVTISHSDTVAIAQIILEN